mgnify:CR=1 FL=1|jgi:transcriptional regulator with XRE-family HTH domain
MRNTLLSGKEIVQIRKSAGLLQRECAEICGIGIRQWQKYESEESGCRQLYVDMIQNHIDKKEGD